MKKCARNSCVMRNCLFFLMYFVLTAVPHEAAQAVESVPVPTGMDSRFTGIMNSGGDIASRLSAFLGVAYREDGVVNDAGKYARFQTPSDVLGTPGLNCSGFVLEASRFLLHSNIPVSTAMRDRLNDSGPESSMGEDWDFGWDLVINIAEGRPHALLLPGGKTTDPSRLSGRERGFDLHAAATWKELPLRLRPGNLYLLSFSKPSTRKGYTLQHYHVGLIWPSPNGELWYYHATPSGNGVNRRDLATADGLASFLRAFANTGNARKMIDVVEITLP